MWSTNDATSSSSSYAPKTAIHKEGRIRSSSDNSLASVASTETCSSTDSSMGTDSSRTIKVYVMLLHPKTKKLEFLQLDCDVYHATIGGILDAIPRLSTEHSLKQQKYVGITRPDRHAPCFTDRGFFVAAPPSDFQQDMNGQSRNGRLRFTMGLQDRELVVAVPVRYAYSNKRELLSLTTRILSTEQVKDVLSEWNVRMNSDQERFLEQQQEQQQETSNDPSDSEDVSERSASSTASSNSNDDVDSTRLCSPPKSVLKRSRYTSSTNTTTSYRYNDEDVTTPYSHSSTTTTKAATALIGAASIIMNPASAQVAVTLAASAAMFVLPTIVNLVAASGFGGSSGSVSAPGTCSTLTRSYTIAC